MDYYKFQELYHHGVKGMKWGVRKEEDRSDIEYRRKKELEEMRYKQERDLQKIEYKKQRSAERSALKSQKSSDRAKMFVESEVRGMNKDTMKSKEQQQKGRAAAAAILLIVGGYVATRVIRKSTGQSIRSDRATVRLSNKIK